MQMSRNANKIKIQIINFIAALLFCSPATQANVYKVPEITLEDVSATIAPVQQLQIRLVEKLALTTFSTTLSVTKNGLLPLAFDVPLNTALWPAFFPVRSKMADQPARQTRNQPHLTTASISSAAAAERSSGGYAIRQELPLFGAHRIRFGKISSGIKVSGLIRKAAKSGSSAICINQCATLADRLTLKGSSIDTQLRHVSASINRLVAYRTDEQSHGRLDYWSTPNETLRRGGGDCEDYAILKMALLSRLGIPVTAMEIVVVKDTSRRLFHAILSVSIGGKSLILDNMTDAVEADSAKRSYAPLFSISGNANYVFGYKGGKSNLMASLADMASVAPGAGF